MKLIHLSDLHLGKRVYDFNLLEDQAYILKEILKVIDTEEPDGVIIAGDIYDKSVPSTEAVELLDEFLVQLSRRDLQVFLISGNHDSPERLAFASRLIASAGIHMSPVYHGVIEPIVLTDAYGPLNVYLLPFVKPARVRRFFPDRKIESYQDALCAAIEALPIDWSGRNVLVTHQFVTGAVRSDSERIRYCGTPLKYSFSEAEHVKSVTVTEIGEKGSLSVRTVPLHPMRDLREIEGTYEELTYRPNYEGTNTEDYLHITLTDEEDIPDAIGKLRLIYPNLMSLDYNNSRTRSAGVLSDPAEADRKSPLVLFEEFYKEQNGRSMSDEQKDFAREIMEHIWEEQL